MTIFYERPVGDNWGGLGEHMRIDLYDKGLTASETAFAVRPDFKLEVSVDYTNTFYEVDFTGRDVVEIVVD